MSINPNDEIALQFARALFELARSKQETTQTLQAAERLAQVYRDSRDFRRFVAHPRFEKEQIQRVLDALDKKLVFGVVLRRSLDLLVRTRNLVLFPKVFEQLQALDAEERGEVKAHVVSARTLSAAQRHAVEEKLLTHFQQSKLFNKKRSQALSSSRPAARVQASLRKRLSLSFSANPALLSGLVITIGFFMIDLSLRSELRRLQKSLSGAHQSA